MPIRSLQKRAIDTLITQLLARVGEDAHVLGPGGAISPSDTRFIGVLKEMLLEAFPGTPEALLSSVRGDLIVVARARDSPSALVGFDPCTLRVASTNAPDLTQWRERFGELLNVTISPTKYLETDLKDPTLTFHESFFAPRSIAGWAKLSRHFARLCASMEELRSISGLKQKAVFYDDRDSHLVPAFFVSANGETLVLEPE